MTKPKICPTCRNSYDASNFFCPLDSAPLKSILDEGELVGSVIAGRYLVSDRIGTGGMGEVYRAQDVRLQRAVALKVMHASLAGDIDALARFNREASNCSKINNQHVIHVHDFGETEDGLAYLVMEFVQGRSLKALISTEGVLEPARVATVIRQIASGLDAAHRLDCPVIHRDLKPDNILVTQDQDGAELVKVADFGISKAILDDSQQVTRTGFVTGTYEYMSPEQVTGGVVDGRSDVYALGLIGFMMLTGQLPFPGETPEHSMLMRLNEAPRTLRAIRPDVPWPGELQQVMNRALARDPAGRYDSAGQFAAELSRVVQDWTEPAVHGGAPGRRRTIWVTAASLVLAAGAAAVVGNWPRTGDTAVVSGTPELVSVDPDSFQGDSARTDTAMVPAAGPVELAPSLNEPNRDSVSERATAAAPSTQKSAPRRAPVRAPKAKAPPATSLDVGSAELERYESILQPDMPRDSALRTLASLNALIPRLKTARDSVEADLFRAEASALAGRSREACHILELARIRATELQRRKIELWVEQGICTAQDWRAS